MKTSLPLSFSTPAYPFYVAISLPLSWQGQCLGIGHSFGLSIANHGKKHMIVARNNVEAKYRAMAFVKHLDKTTVGGVKEKGQNQYTLIYHKRNTWRLIGTSS